MANAPPILAVVSARPAGDGVGYVGLLLERALAEISGHPPRVIALDPATPGKVTRREQLSFLSRLTLAQRVAPELPVVFNHVGIARAQARVPAPVRRPFAVFLHGVEVWDPALDPDRKVAIRGAAIRLSNSRFTARRVGEVHPGLGPIHPCPLALLPETGRPTADDIAEAERWLTAAPGPRTAIIGRMSRSERYKGHDELIECWPQVRARLPNARLFVVGRGDDVERLRTKASSAGLGDAVVFTGFLRDGAMRELLTRCNVFAMPSRGEGFGLAYLEAMRRGLPCIGSDADAAAEVIADGETGCIVPAGDLAALASTIAELLADPSRARALGARGRERERAVFSFDAFQGALEAALRGSGTPA